MIGAIIGDIVGSRFEFKNIKHKKFALFSDDCSFTDDTIMTLAVADALLNGGSTDNFIDSMKKFGKLYPNPTGGYGPKFGSWLLSDDRKPYNSFGNGSAMRVSPCAWFAKSLEEAEELAEISAAVTHNHPEGIKGAKATAAAIYLARTRCGKPEIKEYVEKNYGYDLCRTLDEIRPGYTFNETCQETVPEAIIAFLESGNFDDAIRNAVSLGGDSDTLAAITGSIAEAYYGISGEMFKEATDYLCDDLLSVINAWLDRGLPTGVETALSSLFGKTADSYCLTGRTKTLAGPSQFCNGISCGGVLK
ncbi:MAG: ADP-ribosylglycohydrolase family protein [Holophagales bacterium]|jgi:ADP-ribosylglycohydrolase|nr:ADP-ribosylglycohydrolase family protein [Holophagales bacterium]